MPISKNFNAIELIKFTLPSIATFLFMSTYTIVDGIFVANLVGENALAAINIILPIFGFTLSIGLMFSTGGNAVISKYLGEKKEQKAKEFLTVIYIIGAILGALLTTLGFLFHAKIVTFLGASDALYNHSNDYLLSLAPFAIPIFFLVNVQAFFVTAGKPRLSFFICFIGGISNMILDFFLISPDFCNLGIKGAGYATGIGYTISGVIGFLFFCFNRKGILYFVKPKFHLKTTLLSMYNGMSELVNNISLAITTILFNSILLSIVGEDGVASISVILYIQMFQTALYFGYTIGVLPIIGYNYGAQNRARLNKIVKFSLRFISISSVIIILSSILGADFAINIFISKTSSVFEMAKNGFLIFITAFVFMGFNIFYSAMFTALSNGKVSAIISICRTLIFLVLSLLTLPKIFGLTGVWIAVPVAEFLSIIVGFWLFKRYKDHYGY